MTPHVWVPHLGPDVEMCLECKSVSAIVEGRRRIMPMIEGTYAVPASLFECPWTCEETEELLTGLEVHLK